MRISVSNCPFSNRSTGDCRPGRTKAGALAASWLRVTIASLILLPASGCVQTGPARQDGVSDVPSDRPLCPCNPGAAADGGGAGPYLTLLARFDAAEGEQREALYEEATVAAALHPGASQRLELALLKLSAGHSGYNTQAAETLLESVLADADALSAGAVKLAESYLRLIREYNRLESANTTLRNQLNEAREKLDALTEIEQTVRPGDQIPDQPPEVLPDEQ